MADADTTHYFLKRNSNTSVWLLPNYLENIANKHEAERKRLKEETELRKLTIKKSKQEIKYSRLAIIISVISLLYSFFVGFFK